MGSIKEHMFELEMERADKWIRERLDDEDADEESEEWQELATEYSNLQDYLMEQAEFEAELQWLKKNGSSIIHKQFLAELSELKVVIESSLVNKQYIIYRMSYAHAVTLLEAFLGDTAKALVNENDSFFQNAIINIDELKKAKYSLEYLSTNGLNAKGLAIRELSNILYHNIPKVKRIYEAILNKPINIDLSELIKITEVRHDIVHRNGKTKEGNPIVLTKQSVEEMILHIEDFSVKLQCKINEA